MLLRTIKPDFFALRMKSALIIYSDPEYMQTVNIMTRQRDIVTSVSLKQCPW